MVNEYKNDSKMKELSDFKKICMNTQDIYLMD